MINGFLFDMDGVLYRGEEPIAEGLSFLQRLQRAQKPYLLITNDGCRTPEAYSRKLRRMGAQVPPSRIYSCAQAAAAWIAERRGGPVFVIGERGLKDALKKADIARAETQVTHVVVGLDRHATYGKIAHASRLLQEGAQLVATSRDACYPLEDFLAPGCGALVSALETAAGVTAVSVGKPEPVMYQQAAKQLGLPLNELVMIGDTLESDIAGARNAGTQSVLVLTGNSTLEKLARSGIRPDRVVKTLAELSVEV